MTPSIAPFQSFPLPRDLQALKKFHGHLGPYVVLGFRMGKLARERYPSKIRAMVLCGSDRPRSCMADGIQFSSCCTLGKGNIMVRDEGIVGAKFSDGTTALLITAKPEIVAHIDEEMSHENEEELSLEIFRTSDDELFVLDR